jgi:hypothetical protein
MALASRIYTSIFFLGPCWATGIDLDQSAVRESKNAPALLGFFTREQDEFEAMSQLAASNHETMHGLKLQSIRSLPSSFRVRVLAG